MKANTMHVAIIQTDIVWENPTENRKVFTKKIKAISADVDLFVLPELFTTGFSMNINFSETMIGDTVLWMQEIAQQKQAAIMGSVLIKEDNRYYNRLLFVHPDGQIEQYDKHHLFALSGEDKVFTAGEKKLIVNYKGWRICPLICYDLRFPIWSRNTNGYDVLIYVASWPKKRIGAWNVLLKARAIENMSYTIGVNRVGVDGNGFAFSGNSIALNTLGQSLSTIQPNVEGVEIIKIEKPKQNKLRLELGFLNGIVE